MARPMLVGGALLAGAAVLAGCARTRRDPDPVGPTPTPPGPTPAPPGPTPSPTPSPTPAAGVPIRIAQLNARNLFDTVDQPRVQDDVLTPEAYDRKLGKLALAIRDAMGAPDVIALQEVEHEGVLRDLAARPELRAFGYVPLLVEGSDPRGIDVAYLYRPDRAELVAADQLRTTYLSPGGRNVQLFTRPPLVATFRPRGAAADASAGAAMVTGAPLTLVNNHFTSKLQGADGAAKRLLQAAFVASIADGHAGVAHLDPARVIVLGDLNEALGEPAYESLVAPAAEGQPAPRVNAATHLPAADRYTYRDGTRRSLLDHVLLTPGLDATVQGVRIPHINSDPSERLELDATTFERSSDHNPEVVDLLAERVG